MTSPTILGLDVATKCGWCRLGDGRTTTGVIDCTPTAKGEPEGVRYRRLAEGIQPLLEDIDAVIIEQPFSRGMRTAQVLGGLIAVVLVILEGRGVEYCFVPAPVLKAFGAAHGAKGKEAMRLLACEQLEREVTSDESDAFWLTRYWQDRLRVAA